MTTAHVHRCPVCVRDAACDVDCTTEPPEHTRGAPASCDECAARARAPRPIDAFQGALARIRLSDIGAHQRIELSTPMGRMSLLVVTKEQIELLRLLERAALDIASPERRAEYEAERVARLAEVPR